MQPFNPILGFLLIVLISTCRVVNGDDSRVTYTHEERLPINSMEAAERVFGRALMDYHTQEVYGGYLEHLNSLYALMGKSGDHRAQSVASYHVRQVAPIVAEKYESGPLRDRLLDLAGGVLNHELAFFSFGRIIRHKLTQSTMGEAISRDFGSIVEFKVQIVELAKQLQGPGWIFLAFNKSTSSLELYPAKGNWNPLFDTDSQLEPLTCFDFWDHAYAPRFSQAEWPEYVHATISTYDWKAIGRHYLNSTLE